MISPVAEGLRLGCRPRERLSILDFAERHVMLPHSDRGKQFNRKLAPHLNPIFNAIDDEKIREHVICAPVGSGKTTVFEVLLPNIIAQDPGPAMVVFQSDPDAKDWAEGRLQGVLRSCDILQPLFPKDRHQKRKTAIYFPHMFVLIEGANINNLQAKSLRWAIGDEVWIWDKGLVEELRRRLHDRTNGKLLLFGQAGVDGDDFHTAQDACELWEFQFECPHCKRVQPWRLEQIKYDRKLNPDGTTDWKHLADSVHMECVECKHQFRDDVTTRRMLANSGRAVKIRDGQPGKWAYTFNAFSVWWIEWSKLIAEWVNALDEEKRGDTDPLRQFKQKRLAQRWEEQGSRATDESVLSCRGTHRKGFCPIEPCLVTVCTDTAQSVTHWSAAAFNSAGEMFIFDYGEVLAPEDIPDIINAKMDGWKDSAGNPLSVHAGLMDSGFWTDRIYEVCDKSGGVLFPAKGSPVEQGTWRASDIPDYDRIKLYTYVDFQLKAEVYLGAIGMKKNPRIWFPADSSEDFLRGHMGQRLVIPKGGKKKVFAEVRSDHYGDCTKLHRLCWMILGKEFSQ